MKSASRYWRFIKLSSSGRRQVDDRDEARAFFEATFKGQNTLSDADVQRTLWSFAQQGNSNERALARLCLRCFISYGVEQNCRQLAAQFGIEHGFSVEDLLPYVLDDDGKAWSGDELETLYPSVAVQVLNTFDPSRASLSTWVSRLVKHHRELNRFLLQQGVYLVSDWAILNDTRPPQLCRILDEFHGLAALEIKQFNALLQSYHRVYRSDRLQQRRAASTLDSSDSESPKSRSPNPGSQISSQTSSQTATLENALSSKSSGSGGACVPPTPNQLQRMLADLQKTASLDWTTNQVMAALKILAGYLRQYRIHVRSGVLPTDSLDREDAPIQVAESSMQPDETDDAQHQFLAQFRQQIIDGLDDALDQVVSDRLTALQRRKKGTASASSHHFTEALHLFHCAGKSMGDIAKMLGLKAQYQVTRLLKLKDFRADVRQRLLVTLRDRVRALASAFADPTQLQTLDACLDAALDEHVDTLIQQAETEASAARQEPLKSVFAQRLCRHLNARRQKS